MFVNDMELDALREAIGPLDTAAARGAYRRGDFPRADRVKNLDMRYRWDLLAAANAYGIVRAIYDRGGHDDHIDTALRRIVAPLGGR